MEALGDQLLDQLGAGGLVLDQHDTRPECITLLAHRALQFGIFHAPAQHMQQVKVLALDPPARAHAEIAQLARLVGSVPALHDAVELPRPLVRRVIPEPHRLDEPTALRCRRLLVLAGEIVLADRAADLLEHGERLALGMQGLAMRPGDAAALQRRLDHVRLVVLGDRREAHDLPRLLRQHVAGEVIPRVSPEGATTPLRASAGRR